MDRTPVFSCLLLHNVGLRVDHEGVEINKISSSSNASIFLSFEEWFAIFGILSDLSKRVKTFADFIFEYVLKGPKDGEEPTFENYERIISDKVAVAVSVFKPKTRHFISVSIRSYFYNPSGKMIFRKYPGITINQDEFNSLKCQANQINQSICDLSATHNWHDGSVSNYNACHLCSSVEKHYQSEQEDEATPPLNQRTDFKLECSNPAEMIPAYRRIHEFAEKASLGSILVVTLTKRYNAYDFTLPPSSSSSDLPQLEDESANSSMKRKRDDDDDDDVNDDNVTPPAKQQCPLNETGSFDVTDNACQPPRDPRTFGRTRSPMPPPPSPPPALLEGYTRGPVAGGLSSQMKNKKDQNESSLIPGENTFRNVLKVEPENAPFLPVLDDTIAYVSSPMPRSSTPY